MTLFADPPRAQGAWQITALCTRHVETVSWPGGVAMRADKTPVAVLIDGPDGRSAFDLAGHPLDVATLQAEIAPGPPR